MSFDARHARKGCFLFAIAIAACGDRGKPVDSAHAPAPPPAALSRREGSALARDLGLGSGVTLRLGERVPRGWTSRVANAVACNGSCPDSGYWFAGPLADGLVGIAAHPARDGRIALIQGSYADSIPFDTVAARWRTRLGNPSSEARAAGTDARVMWQDAVTTIELTGTPGATSRTWLILTDDSLARGAGSRR